MNYKLLEKLLRQSNYDSAKTKFVVDGFKNGFDLGFEGDIIGLQRKAPNLKIRVGSEVILWNKIMKEVKLQRVAGPFEEVPFSNYIQSPVGLVPKSDGDCRLIFHLSYPRSGMSVNSSIPDEKCTVKYCDFADAIMRCLQEAKSCKIAKSDMKSAFRQLGVKKSQWCLLIFKAVNPRDKKTYFFVDKAVPFGCSSSCFLFQEVSNCIAHIVHYRTQKLNVNYLDDYFFTDIVSKLCDSQVQVFLDTCALLNLPVSLEKTFWSCTLLAFLGLLIDTQNQFAAIPVDKIQRAKALIESMLSSRSKKTTVHLLQKLTGFLNFLCKAIVPGQTFLQRLYYYVSSSMQPHHHLLINAEM